MVDFTKFLPKKDVKNESEHFWSVIIEPGWVTAGIWRIQDQEAQFVVGSNPCAWELDEELVEASDSALSSAIQGFPEELNEPSKTVFGVASNWVADGEIKEEHLAKIKKICDELSLTPIGFVVLPEAIAHLTKSEEKSPMNGAVIGVYKESIEISVFKLGNLVGTAQVARSVSLADDVVEGLARFSKVDSIPSRFVLYDGKEGELEEARQSLLKVNWEDYENLRLLHTPKVEVVEIKRKILAVSLAGASEIADVTVLRSLEEKSKEVEADVKEESENQEKVLPETMGFVLEKDIVNEVKAKESGKQEIPPRDEVKEYESNVQEVSETISNQVPKKKLDLGGTFMKASGVFTGFFSSMKGTKSVFRSSMGGKSLIYGVSFLVFIIIVSAILWWFYPKAVVTIYVSPKRLEERINVKVDVGRNESDLASNVLDGEILQTTVSGEKTKDTTGTKTVGDKAKGEVTLYRVGTSLSLEGGTILNGPDNLNFLLDDTVNIASGSAGSPGTTKASVSAEDIGAQYNLASNTTFGVDDYSASDIEAKNESAFSGGSSREISAVSSEDAEILEQELVNELSDKAQQELVKDLPNDKIFIEESTVATSSSKTFSHKIGDEATNIKLSIDLETKAITINKAQLVEIATTILKDKIPQGFVLRAEQVSFEFDLQDRNDEIYEFEVRLVANLLPEVDVNEVNMKVRGRYPDVVGQLLEKEVPGFVRTEIKITPTLPGKLKTIPHVSKNIDIEIAAER